MKKILCLFSVLILLCFFVMKPQVVNADMQVEPTCYYYCHLLGAVSGTCKNPVQCTAPDFPTDMPVGGSPPCPVNQKCCCSYSPPPPPPPDGDCSLKCRFNGYGGGLCQDICPSPGVGLTPSACTNTCCCYPPPASTAAPTTTSTTTTTTQPSTETEPAP